MQTAQPSNGRRRDAGFTLTELLIVVVVMGLLATTLAGVVVIVIKTTPSTEARADDARSLQGLVTWLPEDVDAAPPDGFNQNPAYWPCAGPAPANSRNVIGIEFTERSTSTTAYAVSYRYEKRNGTTTMVRYSCNPGGPSSRINLTSGLPEWDDATKPARVVMCKVVVKGTWSDQGNCPATPTDERVGELDYEPSVVRSLKLLVTLGNGIVSEIDAAPKNPDQSLADDPAAQFNLKPEVANTAFSLSIPQGTTQVIDLAPYLGTVNDPDGEESLLSISIDPTEPKPATYVQATTAYTAGTQFQLTLTADPTAPVGPAPNRLMMILSDARGGWEPVTVTINVVSVSNPAPVATGGTTRTYVIRSNDTDDVDVLGYFGVTDDDSGLTVTIDSVTLLGDVAAWTASVDFTATQVDIDTIQLWLANGWNGSAGQTAAQVALTVDDNDGGTLSLLLDVIIASPSGSNNPPTAARTNVAVTIQAGQSVAIDVTNPTGHGITDPDIGDSLLVALRSAPADITPAISGTSVTLTVAPTATAGTPTPVGLRVSDQDGAHVDVTVTVTVTLPAPPPPSCVLGTLTTSPAFVRQGSGTGPRHLRDDVTVTLTYTGSCDGLRLNYNSGDPSGLGTGPGRAFPPGSPTSITIFGNGTGGTEKFAPGSLTLTASTTTAVVPNSISITRNVT
jgi:prepilin-type N-terminal cleavage/methylation domain-containing protein